MDPLGRARVAKLDEVLRRLPPEYGNNKERLRNDVASLLHNCATLEPQMQTFSGGGRMVSLFFLSGVLPISYHGSNYNIPITLYFDPPYPTQAPRCFVTPTEGMAVKPNHQHVDSGGMVYLPFLSNWTHDGQNKLPELVAILASVFSSAPPVYSTGAGAQAASRPVAKATPVPAAAGGDRMFGFLSSYFDSGTASAVPQAQSRPVAVATPVAQARPVVSSQPLQATLFQTPKDIAVADLAITAQQRWPVVLKLMVDEANANTDKVSELTAKASDVEQAVKDLEAAAEVDRQEEARLQKMEEELIAFTLSHGSAPNSEKIREDMDGDSRQVLDSLAEDLALEEVLVALDDLLAGKKIGVDDFMREVRDVSRRQFMCRMERQKAASAMGASQQEVAAAVAPAPAVGRRMMVAV